MDRFSSIRGAQSPALALKVPGAHLLVPLVSELVEGARKVLRDGDHFSVERAWVNEFSVGVPKGVDSRV